MTREEILNSNLSKSEKMRRLFELGLSRNDVASLMEVGYGFVQNVFAKTYPDRVRSRTISDLVEQGVFSFLFNHKFGIEIEAFGVDRDVLRSALNARGIECRDGNRSDSLQTWKITSDGSIHGERAFELVSPILQGEAGLEQLKIVCEVLKAKRAKINKTCGLHVHLDATNFELNTWKKLYHNYATLEETIDSFMPNSRRANNNHFCKSMRITNWESKYKNARDLRHLQSSLGVNSRYFKLNSQSFWRHKSVEFRQSAGTIEFEKISNWVKFLARLVEFSKARTIEQGNWDSLNTFCDGELVNFLQARKRDLV
jgi:hypothetical protein